MPKTKGNTKMSQEARDSTSSESSPVVDSHTRPRSQLVERSRSRMSIGNIVRPRTSASVHPSVDGWVTSDKKLSVIDYLLLRKSEEDAASNRWSIFEDGKPEDIEGDEEVRTGRFRVKRSTSRESVDSEASVLPATGFRDTRSGRRPGSGRNHSQASVWTTEESGDPSRSASLVLDSLTTEGSPQNPPPTILLDSVEVHPSLPTHRSHGTPPDAAKDRPTAPNQPLGTSQPSLLRQGERSSLPARPARLLPTRSSPAMSSAGFLCVPSRSPRRSSSLILDGSMIAGSETSGTSSAPALPSPERYSRPTSRTASPKLLKAVSLPNVLRNQVNTDRPFHKAFDAIGRALLGSMRQTSDQMASLSYRHLESYIQEDNLAGLQAFLASRSVVIDDRDENGATALILAASKGKEDFCRALLEQGGADVNVEDNDQWSALITAAKDGHEAVVSTLLDHGANIHHKDMGGWTALMWACYKGHTSLARLLLSRGADATAQGQHHMTPLVWASGRGHTEIVRALLEHDAKVNIGDKFGTTPLIWACRKGYYEIAEDLLKHGANYDAAGMYSWTPLLVSTRGNYVDLVYLLLEYRTNVNALDKDGFSALAIACKEGYVEIANALLKAGAYVGVQDRNGDSNLIHAARGGHKAVVEALLKKHADVDMVGKDKKTALYWAVEKGHNSVVKTLLSASPDLEQCVKDGSTALLRAVRSKNADATQLLVDKKANVSAQDKKGDTALHIAMRGRLKRIAEILLRNPNNKKLLYRPNRLGETPYNIDLSSPKTILDQIFGARRLNANEDSENILGYDLYSSSLADILSEPSLSMPISVGLFAKWGSGKSFLINKLKDEMSSFARQWVEPLFQFTPLVFILVFMVALILGLIVAVPMKSWIAGVATGGGIFLFLIFCLIAVWHGSRRYDWEMWYKWSLALARQMASFKLVLQVTFCSPPGPQWKEWKGGVQAPPLKFIFAEGAKPSSTAAGENTVVQMLGSLFDMVEREYGMFATRFYRAFRPRAHSPSAPWRYRRLCCLPYIVLFFITLFCAMAVAVLAGLYGFHGVTDDEPMNTEAAMSVAVMVDEDEEDLDDDSMESREDEYKDERPFHGKLINPLLITLGVLVAVVVISNMHTLTRMTRALVFSHRRHLLRGVAKLETVKAEGYLQTLKSEVNLMMEMAKCLDAFTAQQTRMVIVVDGLDSCEQDKVLSVLDAVHTLFTDTSAPFIILLAIDPHIITKAIELHVHRVFSESSISGHDYLRNIVHLPFYLQNSGLRRVRQAQQVAERLKGRCQSTWLEVETDSVSIATTSAVGGMSHGRRKPSAESENNSYIPANRRLSNESGFSLTTQNLKRTSSKGSSRRQLKQSDSVASSIGSNLSRVGGAQDLTKVLLTDDYFSDINPRSLRRLMNVIYITGRLLKAFHIDFNWYHLALWINITEQWPYRASWIILYYEANEETIDDKSSMKELYEKVKNQVPNTKDMEPLLEMDKEEKKFEIFLSMHKSSLHVTELKMFLPFTINLDPFIRKVIKEDQPQLEDPISYFAANPNNNPWNYQAFDNQSKSSSINRRQVNQLRANQKNSTSSIPPPYGNLNPMMWGAYGGPFLPSIASAHSQEYGSVQLASASHIPLPAEATSKKLSLLTIDGLFELFSKVEGVSEPMLPNYKEKFYEHNINGKVLTHCDLDDLKKVLQMNFGDWELFRMLVLGLREREQDDDLLSKNVRFADSEDPDYSNDQLTSLEESTGTNSLARKGSSRSSSGGGGQDLHPHHHHHHLHHHNSNSTTTSSSSSNPSTNSGPRRSTKQNLLAKQRPRNRSRSPIQGISKEIVEESEEEAIEEYRRQQEEQEEEERRQQKLQEQQQQRVPQEKKVATSPGSVGQVTCIRISYDENGPHGEPLKQEEEEEEEQEEDGNEYEEVEEGMVMVDADGFLGEMQAPQIIVQQVTLEEQLIFGVLQTLNEEACEDVMEEQERADLPDVQTHLSTIPSGDDGDSEEMDVMYLQSSPLVPHKVVGVCPSEGDSATPSLCSSFSPYKTPTAPLSRTSSLRCSSNSTSPKHSTEKPPVVTSLVVPVPPPVQTTSPSSHASSTTVTASHTTSPPMLKSDRVIKIIEPHMREASPARKLAVSNSSSPLRRDRPQSLNLGRREHRKPRGSDSGGVRDVLYLEDGGSSPMDDISLQLELSQEGPLSSLPDLPSAAASSIRHVSLTEQFSASSMEKLRRLKHKLHRALGHEHEHEDIHPDETSPLVLATPAGSSPSRTPELNRRPPSSLTQNAHTNDTYVSPSSTQDSPSNMVTTTRVAVGADRETPV
ncbi:ankyrin repeat-rich membrane spanning isoform X4 [Oratosquilla oratoria]|uniref:ankyrin repeat-rich membrane spanning isoform X4 n=1 Tax=Oratosquilla oratoria TaxID=337810 RepID=UPI003F76F6E7